MLSRHNNYLFTIVKWENPFLDLVHLVMNYAIAFKLKYKVQFLQPGSYDIAYNMQSAPFIQDASFSTCCHYTCVAKFFFRSNKVLTFVPEQSKLSSGGHDLGLVLLDDDIFFSSNEERARLLVMAADGHINKLTLYVSFHAESFYHFLKKVLAPHCDYTIL